MRIKFLQGAAVAMAIFLHTNAFSAVIATTGTVTLETSPYPTSSDFDVFVFDEQQGIAFTELQTLDTGSIVEGTLVNSHYVQFDPTSPSGSIGMGSITFDGPILAVIFSTEFLNQDLGSLGTSDSYFGFADSLGAYPTGLNPDARGLGSAEDDLFIVLGSNTLVINSLDIPTGPSAGNLDGFRVITAVPLPGALILLASALIGIKGIFPKQETCV